MVEPGAAFYVAAVHLAGHVEMRAAVVVARLVRSMSLATQPLLPLQDELARGEAHLQIEIARGDACVVAIAVLLEPPVVDPYAGALELGVRERESGARGALVVHQPPALGIAQRRVREEDLARVELARVIGFLLRPGAKERDLEPERTCQPSRDVPPLDARSEERRVGKECRSRWTT